MKKSLVKYRKKYGKRKPFNEERLTNNCFLLATAVKTFYMNKA